MKRFVVLVFFLLLAAVTRRARADEDDTQVARREFVTATEFVKEARWGEALSSFERSAQLRPHALTTYNIGACERALGRYVRARATLRRSLTENTERGGKELPESFATQAKEYIDELEGIIVHLDLTIAPSDAELLIDGRPPPPREPGGGSFDLDPGLHIFQLTRQGFARAATTKTFAPGARDSLHLDLARLPATLHISANEPDAVVAVGGLDVGVAPIDVTRPAGSYPVLVRKPGYVAYAATVDLGAGGDTKLRASLVPENKPLYARWWFWAGAVGVVAAATVTTFLLTRPDPQAPPPDQGGLGWVVPVGR